MTSSQINLNQLTRKLFYKILFGIILYCILNITFKVYKNATVSDVCYTNILNETLIEPDSLKINSTYNFDEIFDCGDWDEILVIGFYYDRIIGYLSSGVLVPQIDYNAFFEGSYLVYFLKNNHLVSKPIQLYRDNFILSTNFRNQYFKVRRENAVFIYTEIETIGFDYPVYGFNLIE